MTKEFWEKELHDLQVLIKSTANFINTFNFSSERNKRAVEKELVDLLKKEKQVKKILTTKYGVESV